MNFVENAGVSLTAACFANSRYIEGPAQRCFSNLLAIGFHRYEVDVYWDVSRQLWSLCPAEMGGSQGSSDAAPSGATEATRTTNAAQSTGLSMIAMSSAMDPVLIRRHPQTAERRQATESDSSLDGATLAPAPTSATTVDPDETSISTSNTASAAASSVSSTDGALNAGDFEQLGSYACSESVDVDWLSRIMWTYLDTTETNLNATLRYLILNLHAAAPASDSGGGADELSSDDLPDSGDLLSSVLSSNLSSFLYTPADLQQQRSNINESWYDVPQGMDPDSAYYNIRHSRELSSTPDGWPSENYVEMQEGKRLFLGFGSIDAQMQNYDVSRDDGVIFPQDYLQNYEQLAIDATGEVTSRCFYTPSDYSISSINNSWAFAAETTSSQPDILFSSSNVTRCGISPILNITLENATADENFLPYQTYRQSTIWSWAPNYPRTANDSRSLSENDTNDNQQDLGAQPRCAALNASSGFWQNVICDGQHYSACRQEGSIYDWSISSEDAGYTKAGLTCREGSEFDVPRTGLQNAYLLNTWRAHLADPTTDANAESDQLLWLNFNNLDSELCWVVGQNSTCPYVSRRSDDRRVIVPVVAAVVVFALGVLTVFVKCAANRQMNKRQKRRRRGDDGWDYEGVPS